MEENINYEITPTMCDESITQEVYLKVGFKTSVCVLILNTGFEALGYYSPIDDQDFNISEGKNKARDQAIIKAKEHLSAINQWRKTVADIKKEELEAEKEGAKSSLKEEKPTKDQLDN